MPPTNPKQPLVLADGTRRGMSVAEVADLLGITQKHVWNEINRGHLRARQLGGPKGIVRILAEDVDAWCEASIRPRKVAS